MYTTALAWSPMTCAWCMAFVHLKLMLEHNECFSSRTTWAWGDYLCGSTHLQKYRDASQLAFSEVC